MEKFMTNLVKAFGMIMADQKPYSEQEQAARTFVVEFYGQPPKSFRAGKYAKHYSWQSFRPEGRAACDLGGMVERIETVKNKAEKLIARAPTAKDDIEAAYNHFANRHIEFSLAYIAANSNLASAMITGPSNFPVARQRKLNDQHHRKWERLGEHVKIGIKSLSRAAFPHGDPRHGIRSNNPEAVELLEAKIAKLEENQNYYKKANRDVRASMKKEDPAAHMLTLGYSEEQAKSYVKFEYSWMKNRAFDSYVTTNNLANIKRLKSRLVGLKKAKETITENLAFILPNEEEFELVRNTDAMRIQLLFDGKPSNKTRAALKSGGFRWAPSQTAWQRHLNNNGEYALKRLLAALGATQREA